MAKGHKDRKHAILSASGASRWLNCTPSALLESKIESKSSVYADEGTLAHEISENELKWALRLQDFKAYNTNLSKLKKNALYKPEMLDFVAFYVDYVISCYTEAKKEDRNASMVIEERVDFSFYVPDGFGTSDVRISWGNQLIIIDLKYGAGVRVDAYENSQLKLYALGAYLGQSLIQDIDDIKMVIVQPRMDNISSHIIESEELIGWAEKSVKRKAQMAIQGRGEFIPGDWCKFCKIKANCPAYFNLADELAKEAFSLDEEYFDIKSDDELLHIYEKSKLVIDFLKAVNLKVMTLAFQGKKWPGYKIVEGRSTRVLINEEAAADILTDVLAYTDNDIYNKKIKGITELTSLIGKKVFDSTLGDYYVKKPGKPVLVPESDKRPETTTAALDFMIDDDSEEEIE